MIRITFVCSLLIVLLLLVFSQRRPESDDVLREPAEHSPAADASTDDSAVAVAADSLQMPDLTAMTAALVAAIPQNSTTEKLFATTCAACHGAQGEGNRQLGAPSIAGLPAWFSMIQFEKFANGQRGQGDGDIGGRHMVTITKALDAESLPGLAKHIAGLPIVLTTNELGGNVEIGEEKFMEFCAGCHRYNGHGEKAFRSAPLSGLQDWYILDSLKKFRAEARGYHREDIDGIFMHRNMQSVTDEDFIDIVAYIAELSKKHPPRKRRPLADGDRSRDLIR